MGPHEPFKFEWDGKPYEVPADEQTKLIAAIEDVVTAFELANFVGKRGAPPTAKLAMAFGILLRHVGAKGEDGPITDNEVRVAMFGAKATPEATLMTMLTLLNLMGALDESAIVTAADPQQDGTEAAASSSEKSSKRQSDKAG